MWVYRVIRVEADGVEEQEAFVETLEEAELIAEEGADDYGCEHRVIDRWGEVVSWWGAGA